MYTVKFFDKNGNCFRIMTFDGPLTFSQEEKLIDKYPGCEWIDVSRIPTPEITFHKHQVEDVLDFDLQPFIEVY